MLRRLATAICAAAVLSVFLLGPTASAQDDDGSDVDPSAGTVPIVEVNGLVDPIVASFMTKAIKSAEAEGAIAVVFQVNSKGSVLDDEALAELAATIADSEVPIAFWVGPSGARALGEVAELAALADRIGVAPGARLGETGVQDLDEARFGKLWGDNAELLSNGSINHEQAIEFDIADFPAPIVGEFILTLTDLGVQASAVDEGTQLDTIVRFEGLSLFNQLLHTVASPPVAYLLFAIGLALLVFEFYTAGVGVAGVIGAVMVLLGSYGLTVLPTRWWAVTLIVLSMVAFSVDVQTGVPRFWTVVGSIFFIVGTLWLYTDGISMSWVPIVVGIIGVVSSMLTGMPTMVRTRFSTPTIGREWMIGEMGTAVEAVSPDGVVSIRDSLWRARTNRATPIAVGEPLRVVAIEGLWLEVEPEEGAARDYRERRKSADDEGVTDAEDVDLAADDAGA